MGIRGLKEHHIESLDNMRLHGIASYSLTKGKCDCSKEYFKWNIKKQLDVKKSIELKFAARILNETTNRKFS